MALGCVTAGGTKPPDTLIDTTTLTVSLSNDGTATLNIVILKKTVTPITNACFNFQLNNAIFKGFIDSDDPRRLPGTEYFEHNITAIGTIC